MLHPAPTVLSLALQFLAPSSVFAQMPSPIWTGNNSGYARQISLAISPTRIFLSEAGLLTVIDRATHAPQSVRLDFGEYLPVATTLYADGLLWLSLGYDAPHSNRRIAMYDPSSGRIREVTRTHDVACSLTRVGGWLYWVEAQGRHISRLSPGGRPTVVATAPTGRRFVFDCRFPLATDGAQLYLALGSDNPRAPTPLVSIATGNGALRQLDPDIARRSVFFGNGTLVLAYAVGAQMSIERFDLGTGVRATLVANATVMSIAVQGDSIVYLDGNYFRGDDYFVRRVRLSGGGPQVVAHGDRRLAGALAFDAAGIVVLVQGHPSGECETHHPIEPGDQEFTRCSAPDHQLYELH